MKENNFPQNVLLRQHGFHSGKGKSLSAGLFAPTRIFPKFLGILLFILLLGAVKANAKTVTFDIEGLKAPSAGAEAKAFTGSTDDGLASWAVEWYKASDPITVGVFTGKFAPSTKYKAKITVQSDNLSKNLLPAVSDNPQVFIDGKTYSTGNPACVYTLADGIGTIILEFDDTETTIPKYTGGDIKVTKPVAGETPSGNGIVSGTGFTGYSVAWSPAPIDGKFQPGISYTAAIKLTAELYYTFYETTDESDYFKVTITGGSATKITHAANSGEIAVGFSATALQTGKDITNLVAIPEAGAPVLAKTKAVDNFQTVDITWKEGSSILTVNNDTKFEPGKVYTAEFTLTPATTHTVFGIADDALTYTGATVTYNSSTKKVVITFKSTAKTIDINDVVGGSSLEDWRKALADAQPKAGAAPLTAGDLKVTNKTFKVTGLEWKTKAGVVLAAGEKFAANTEYEAYLTLTPEAGYTTVGLTKGAKFSLGNVGPANIEIVDFTAASAVFKVFGYTATQKNPAAKDAFSITAPKSGDLAGNVTKKYSSYNVGEIGWSPDLSTDNKFLPDTRYVATFDVELTSGAHTLYGLDPGFYEIAGSDSVVLTVDNSDPKKGSIKAYFPATYPTISNVFGIPAPVAGETPGTITLPGTPAEYTATIAWYEGETNYSTTFTGTVFAPDKVYNALLVITPETGYTTYGLTEDGIIAANQGVTAVKFGSAIDPTRLRLVFEKTKATLDINIEEDGYSTLADWNTVVDAAQPKAGSKPVTEVELTNPSFTIESLEWKNDQGEGLDDNGNFAANTVYKAYLTLKPTADYTTYGLPDNSGYSFPLGTTGIVEIAESGLDYAIFSITYPKTDRNPSLATAFGITKPVAGEAPATVTTPSGAYVVDNFTWKAETGEAVGAKFGPDTVYVASFEIKVTAPGVTLYGVDPNFYNFADATSSVFALDGEDFTKGTLTVTFPKTDETIPFTFNVKKPVAGESPQAKIEAPNGEYTATIAWRQGSTNVSTSSKFAADREYTARITVTSVAPGYTLYGLTPDAVTVPEGRDVIKENGVTISSMLYSIVFKATAKTIVINDEAPIKVSPTEGQQAPGTVDGADYTGTITWTYINEAYELTTLPTGAPFVLNQVYTAKIGLTANQGSTVYGLNIDGKTNYVEKGVFTPGAQPVETATSVTHEANSDTVIIVYKPTPAQPKVVSLPNSVKITNLAVAGTVIDTRNSQASTIDGVTSQVEFVLAGSDLRWIPNENATGGKFQASKEYHVTVVVKAKPGYTLDGVSENFFEVAGATRVEHVAGTSAKTLTLKVIVKTGTLITEKALNIAAPKAGEEPQRELVATDELQTAVINWYEIDGTTPAILFTDPVEGKEVFDVNHIYVAKVSVKPNADKTLFGLDANFFEVEGATTIKNSKITSNATSVAVTITFDTTGVVFTDLNAVIEAPVAGVEAPKTAESTQWTADIEWIPALPADGKFEVNKEYTAKLTSFVAKDKAVHTDYIYFYNWWGFTINGAAPVAADWGTITSGKFKRTDRMISKTITVNAGFVPTLGASLPEGNAFSIAGAKLSEITWTPELKPGDKFVFGEEYSVSAKITPNTNYTLYGLTEDYFTAPEGTSVIYDVESSTITITFTALARTINELAIPKIEVPVVGKDAVRGTFTEESEQYNFTVTWTATRNGVVESFSGATFQHGIVYTAKVKITPKAGYVVCGLGKDVFYLATDETVKGKNSAVTKIDATSVTVTIEFPAADYPTGITAPQANGLTVVSIDGTLKINGLTIGEQVSVYNLQGALVSRKQAISSEQELSLPSGTYIVVSGAKKVKALHK
ncbi:MAG: hypothetical protein LBC48_05080 [Dysgonamonadaceae bacterium]|jgi:hypothetical protein|nr:hypothetical protein [Dysgonamonadaceae bacterium]